MEETESKYRQIMNLTEKEKELLLLVQKTKRINRRNLADSLNITPSKTYRMIETMVSRKMILTLKDSEESSVGRPCDIISLNPSYAFFFSICIRRFCFRTAIIGFNSEIIEQECFLCDEKTSPNQLRDLCLSSYKRLIKNNLIKESDLIGTLISSFNTEPVTKGMNSHPGLNWQGVDDIKLFFSEVFSGVVFSSNVSLAAACEQYYSYFFNECNNLAYIILDEGIGIGYIIDKRIARKSMQNVNCLAHMVVDINGPKCFCGQHGCLETLASETAILEKAREKLIIRGSGVLYEKADCLRIEDICDAAEQGDALARDCLEDAACILAIGIENFLNIFRLEVIVLSGNIICNSHFFYDSLVSRLHSRHPQLIVISDNQELESALQGITKLYFNELLHGEIEDKTN